MKIASVTAIYKGEHFIRPHFDMLKDVDENIVLYGRRPFKDYLANGILTEERDNARQILEKEYPHVKIVEHDIEWFCGDLLNLGMQKARELGCDAIIKLDLDMFLRRKDWTFLLEKIRGDKDLQCYALDYKVCTEVLVKDFDHMISGMVFEGLGSDPLVVSTKNNFINDGVRIATDAEKVETINWPDFMVYHFTGWRANADDEEIKRIENLPLFYGWESCAQEIKEMVSP